MKDFLISAWSFLSELALAILLLVILLLVFDKGIIVTFIDNTLSEWFSLIGQVLFPASIATWITFTNIAQSKFGDYLEYRNKEAFFRRAFLCPVVIQLSATLILILAKGSGNELIKLFATVLICYSLIVTVTMIRNSTIFISLYRKFKNEFDAN